MGTEQHNPSIRCEIQCPASGPQGSLPGWIKDRQHIGCEDLNRVMQDIACKKRDISCAFQHDRRVIHRMPRRGMEREAGNGLAAINVDHIGEARLDDRRYAVLLGLQAGAVPGVGIGRVREERIFLG